MSTTDVTAPTAPDRHRDWRAILVEKTAEYLKGQPFGNVMQLIMVGLFFWSVQYAIPQHLDRHGRQLIEHESLQSSQIKLLVDSFRSERQADRDSLENSIKSFTTALESQNRLYEAMLRVKP